MFVGGGDEALAVVDHHDFRVGERLDAEIGQDAAQAVSTSVLTVVSTVCCISAPVRV